MVLAPTKTLFDRLGGDAAVNIAIGNFFDEIVEDPYLSPFFKDISVSALRTHQMKLFKVIFGPEDEKPDQRALLEFMLATHTRLFRDMGLNETHFDQVAACFVRGLQALMVDQDIIDECAAILIPMRVVFEYGAKVANEEKKISGDPAEFAKLPIATSKSIEENDFQTKLPDPSFIQVPQWLSKTLRKVSKQPSVRAWTCDLTDRFGANGDLHIADTFMDQTYMYHHVYLVAFMQLAFKPHDMDASELLEIVKFPRGPKKAMLSRNLWNRMIVQFEGTCWRMMTDTQGTSNAVDRLKSYSCQFPEVDAMNPVHGIKAPHILRRSPIMEIDTLNMIKSEKKGTGKKIKQGSKSTAASKPLKKGSKQEHSETFTLRSSGSGSTAEVATSPGPKGFFKQFFARKIEG